MGNSSVLVIPFPLIRRTREIMGLEEPGKPKHPGEIKELVTLETRKQINQGDNGNQRNKGSTL